MGEARRRQSAQTNGRPWPPRLPSAATSPLTANMSPRALDHLSMLTRTTEASTLGALRAAQSAESAAARDAALESILTGAGALLEDEVHSAYSANDSVVRLWNSLECRQGCSWCCQLTVETTIVEALVIAGLVAKSPERSAAVRQAGPKVTGATPEQRAAAGLQSCNVELTAALYLIAVDPDAPARWLRGETVFQPYP